MRTVPAQATEAHRTHVRTRGLANDVLFLRGEVTKLRGKLEGNSAKIDNLIDVTRQVRDILITFKVTNAVAKWVVSVGAAFAALYYGWTHIK